jgi:hypothetical protein
MSPAQAELGFLAYRTYCASFNGQHQDGTKRKHWDDLSDMSRRAWTTAALAVKAVVECRA